MASTVNLGLPLIAPSQAQKHVTVNESLARLDAAAQLRVSSSALTAPPGSANEGEGFLVPVGATGEWEGRGNQIAVWSNGGWVYLAPKAGWRAWDESRMGYQLFDGSSWVVDAVAVSSHGAAMIWRIVEFDHVITAGSSNLTQVKIPNQAQVIGVTGRVSTSISGAGVTGWKIGVVGSENRYGSGLGLKKGTPMIGLSGTPTTYYSDTSLLISSEGGSFSSGGVRIAINLVLLSPPRSL